MPTLFDSHEEFNEWFSRDIENHAENKSAIDQGISENKVTVLDRGEGLLRCNSDREGKNVLLGLQIFYDLFRPKNIGNFDVLGLTKRITQGS